ncbi:MAG: PilC/PilY family type IV pilus protein [Myxococcota bacterium]
MSGPDSLDAIRPYGGTPIAGLLSDIEYYFTTHNDVRSGFTIGVDADGDGAPDGDPFYECRERYAILTTDGRPGSSMRGDPVFCENSTLAGYECPYPLPEDIAANLCAMSGGECTGVLDGLFVVGLNVSETDIRDELDRIALNGGTTQAYFASTAADLRSALDTILSQASRGTTTRTSPAFSRTASPGSLTQYQFNSGFRIPENENAPWEGVLERRRFSCSGTTVEEQTLTASDLFHETINAMDPAARNIWTVLPTNPGLAEGRMEGSVDTAADYGVPMPGDPALERGLGLVSFTAANIAPDYFNLSPSETGQRDDIVEWIRGDHPDREDNHFGDIYHSSPAVVGPPGSGIDDDSYNDFRELPYVATRPIVVYVGTNDGLLHAIAAEDTTGVTDQSGNVQSVSEGEELWAFAPPMILSKLDAVTTGHTWTVDGIPMVKDVFLGRDAGGGDSNDYRTVLVMGFRAGGNGYFALDVTSPLEPEFLWQFSTPTMGEAYGQPAIGQVLVEINGQLHERGVVVVGGGRSSAVNTSGCAPPASHFSDPGTVDGYASRSQRGCYGSGIGSGKALYVLDVATGRPLARIEEGNFHAPVSGSVSLYSGAVGSIATSGYFTDEDGILYRLDLSSTNPSNWSVSGLFDLYSGRSATEGQSSFYPPVVAVDEASNPIVIVGTGDVDRLDTAATFNRIFSFKEEVQFDLNGTPTGSIDLTVNWKLDLDAQELVTGPIDYFDGVVYFGTFVSAVNPTDYCSFGASRMWGLDYIQEQSPSGSEIPVGRFESLDGSGDPIEVHRLSGFAAPSLGALTETVNTDLENTVVLGVGVSQEPTCVTGASVNDPYVASSTGSHFQVNGSSGSRFRLVAQLSGGDSNNSMPGGTVNEFSQDLEPPAAFTNVRSVAVSVD